MEECGSILDLSAIDDAYLLAGASFLRPVALEDPVRLEAVQRIEAVDQLTECHVVAVDPTRLLLVVEASAEYRYQGHSSKVTKNRELLVSGQP